MWKTAAASIVASAITLAVSSSIPSLAQKSQARFVGCDKNQYRTIGEARLSCDRSIAENLNRVHKVLRVNLN